MTENRVPRRIQRRRTPGWRMPDGAIYVGRPSRWGNPYSGMSPADAVRKFAAWIDHAAECATEESWRGQINALRGSDLACWCRLCDRHKDGLPLGERCPDCDPCHADVLLALANAPETEEPAP